MILPVLSPSTSGHGEISVADNMVKFSFPNLPRRRPAAISMQQAAIGDRSNFS
jgi:hypothetical protein